MHFMQKHQVFFNLDLREFIGSQYTRMDNEPVPVISCYNQLFKNFTERPDNRWYLDFYRFEGDGLKDPRNYPTHIF